MEKYVIPAKQLRVPCIATITQIDNYYLPADQVIFSSEMEEITKDGILLKSTLHFSGQISLIIRFSLGKMPLQAPTNILWQRREKEINFSWCEYNNNIDVDTHVKIVQYLRKHGDELVYK